MHRIHTVIHSISKTFCRKLTSKPYNFIPRHVDLKKKIVYGGDIGIPISEKSFGSILYERLTEKSRQDEIIQICTATGHQMTTRRYVERSIAVAEKLREKGIQKGDFIVLVGNNSLNMNTALTGIFFIGAVPVPLSYKTSMDEFKHILRHIKPKFFGCDLKNLFSFKRALQITYGYKKSDMFLLNQKKDSFVEDIESFGDFIATKEIDVNCFKPAEIENPKEELALVMKAITDGLEGRSIGITHYNLNAVIARYDSANQQKLRDTKILMVQKVMWMSGIYSLIISTCFGSKLIVMNEFDEEEFMKAIEEYKVTTSLLYSSKLWQLYKYNFRKNYDLSSCEYIYALDGSLPQNLIDRMKEKTGLTLRNSYELSELTGLILQSRNNEKKGSVGRLLPMFYGKVISDKNFQNVGPNEKGELCFKGPTLTKGYINDEKQNKGLIDKEGFLLSGHYGYYDKDGDFYIIDKIHYFIQYKGLKISPRELEGIIKSLDAVKDVCVSGIEHSNEDFFPIAFIAIQKGQNVTANDIIKYVNGKVSDYKKLRGGVIFLPKIPRSRESGLIKRTIFKKILSNYRIKEEITLTDSSSEAQKPYIDEKTPNINT